MFNYSEFLSKIGLVYDFYVEKVYELLIKGSCIFTGKFVAQRVPEVKIDIKRESIV